MTEIHKNGSYKDSTCSTILGRLFGQQNQIINKPSKPSSEMGQFARDRFSKEVLFAKPWKRTLF